eukprot:GSMAST32.ASY1.ANO1.1253.1 assembled CDS
MLTSKSIPLLFYLDDIERVISDHSTVINNVAEGFIALSSGKCSIPPIQTMGSPPFHPFKSSDSPNSSTCVKSGYIDGGEFYVTKVASGGFTLNPRRKLGSPNTGLMLIFSQTSGKLEAILFDEGILTEIRTAAAGALSTQLFAPQYIRAIGVIGAGIQARWQLRLLQSVTTCKKVLCYSKTRASALLFQTELNNEGWDVEIVLHPKVIATEADVIICVTPSREPMYYRKTPVLINAIGADSPGKQELDVELVFTDCVKQTAERGEFQHAIQSGKVNISRVKEIGSILLACQKNTPNPNPNLQKNTKPKNTAANITIFDTSGVAVQDVVISKMVYNSLRKRSINRERQRAML